MQRLEADGYYLVHNHPSGKPTASGQDYSVSINFKNNVPGFKDHLILDHDTYGTIELDYGLKMPYSITMSPSNKRPGARRSSRYVPLFTPFTQRLDYL